MDRLGKTSSRRNGSPKISATERKILAVLQNGFPKSRTPFEDMARCVGTETEELFRVLENWKQQGKLRRIGAIVNHFEVGLAAGAMVLWQVEPERIDEVGTILAGFDEVSHAYERHTAQNWPYNIYTMVHSANAKHLQRTIQRMSKACGATNYRVLVTEKELKKAAPTYFK
jgi:DNA-binding Lrp family transcriptional regulator